MGAEDEDRAIDTQDRKTAEKTGPCSRNPYRARSRADSRAWSQRAARSPSWACFRRNMPRSN